jgi:xanthine dehydrogenase YagT iron-sulfur-binding subunit
MATVVEAISAAGRALVASSPRAVQVSRRELVVGALLTALAAALSEACHVGTRGWAPPTQPSAADVPSSLNEVDVTLQVNGAPHTLHLEPRVSLLDALRERMGLTGTKRGATTGSVARARSSSTAAA